MKNVKPDFKKFILQKLSEVEIKEIHEYTDGADKYSRLLLVAIVILVIHKVGIFLLNLLINIR